MVVWGIFNLQEASASIIELINYFHDHMLTLLSAIITFVSYIFLIVLLSDGVDHYIVDSHLLEIVWTVVPIFFLIFIALPSLYLLYMTEDLLTYSLVVNVIAHQWYWEYQYYSDSIVGFNSYMVLDNTISSPFRLLEVDNRLVLPHLVGSLIIVTSADVLHSWTVPSFGVNADAIPGRLNYLSLIPFQYGVFYGQCSELCGSNHSFIPIVVEVVDYNFFISHLDSLANS